MSAQYLRLAALIIPGISTISIHLERPMDHAAIGSMAQIH
jgi:hypothetical protein